MKTILFSIALVLVAFVAQAQNIRVNHTKDIHFSKLTLVKEQYDEKTETYVKVYSGERPVKIILSGVDTASYRLHKGQKSLPTSANLTAIIIVGNVAVRVFLEDALRFTRQIRN